MFVCKIMKSQLCTSFNWLPQILFSSLTGSFYTYSCWYWFVLQSKEIDSQTKTETFMYSCKGGWNIILSFSHHDSDFFCTSQSVSLFFYVRLTFCDCLALSEHKVINQMIKKMIYQGVDFRQHPLSTCLFLHLLIIIEIDR